MPCPQENNLPEWYVCEEFGREDRWHYLFCFPAFSRAAALEYARRFIRPGRAPTRVRLADSETQETANGEP